MRNETITGIKRSHYCGEINRSMVGETVVLMGWVNKIRDMGKLIFIDLRDRTGICQISMDEDTKADLTEKAKEIGNEYVIAVVGTVRVRQSINEKIKNGDIELYPDELRILNRSETPPIYVKDDDDVAENLRLKYRYLDLRKSKMQHNFKLRHRITHEIRNFLDEEGFLEIETPILSKTTPEGARDYLVPSRVNPGSYYALPQSPQLFKQLLMVSGFDKYYQIARCFRDEDLRADRQPEFTQVDCEMSFVEMDDVMNMAERMMQRIYKKVLHQEISLPLLRMDYDEAMQRFGSDKPDMRFGMELHNVSDILKDIDFGVYQTILEQGGTIQAINAKGLGDYYSRKKIKTLENEAALYGAKGLSWIKYHAEETQSSIAKFLTEQMITDLQSALEAEPGDVLFLVAAKTSVALNALGHVRLAIAKECDLLKGAEDKMLFVTRFPLFEYDPDEDRYVAMHHPFTSPLDEDLELFETAPEKMRAKAYDIVLNGTELGGGSIRIFNTEIQKKMFRAIGMPEEEANEKFDFLLEAFRYGTPPHGGIALGLDRLVMLLLKQDNIREVIAFPKTQNASCPLTNAPSAADPKTLDELGVESKKQD